MEFIRLKVYQTTFTVPVGPVTMATGPVAVLPGDPLQTGAEFGWPARQVHIVYGW